MARELGGQTAKKPNSAYESDQRGGSLGQVLEVRYWRLHAIRRGGANILGYAGVLRTKSSLPSRRFDNLKRHGISSRANSLSNFSEQLA